MNMYIYEGITESGEKIKGKFFGTKEELLKEVQKQKILITNIKEDTKKLKKGKYTNDDFSSNIEELSYLLSSGVQLDKAISLIIKNSRKKAVIEFWEDVLRKLKEGKSFSMALKETGEKHNFPIPTFYINIISVGEEVGDLKGALKTLLEDLEFKGNLIKEIKSALAYPAFLLIVSVLTIFFVAGFILPKFSNIFSPSEIEKLPTISKFTLSFGKTLNQNLDVIVFGFVFLVVGLVFLFSSREIQTKMKNFIYRMPYIKNIILKVELSYILSSLGTMLNGGVEISKAIKLSSRVTNHNGLKAILEETYNELKKGHKISQIWRKYDIIPEDIISLTIVGENSAKLGEIFEKLGRKYMENFKNEVGKLLVFLEPAIIVVLGLFIAFIVVAIMLAVVSVSDIYG